MRGTGARDDAADTGGRDQQQRQQHRQQGGQQQPRQQPSLRRMREWEMSDSATSAVPEGYAGGAHHAQRPPDPVPSQAVENARRFLWDEDEDPDGGATSRPGGPGAYGADRPTLPGYGPPNVQGGSGRSGGTGGGGSRSRRSSLSGGGSSRASTSSRALTKAAMSAPPGYHLDESTVRPLKVPKKDTKRLFPEDRTASSRSTASSSWSVSIRGFLARHGSENLAPPPIMGTARGDSPMMPDRDAYPVPQGYPAAPARSGVEAFLSAFEDKAGAGSSGWTFGPSAKSALSSWGTSLRQTFAVASANRTGGAPAPVESTLTMDYADGSIASEHQATLDEADALASDIMRNVSGQQRRERGDDSPGGFAACCTSAACALGGTTPRRRAMLLVAAAAILVTILAVVVPRTRSNPGPSSPTSSSETLGQSSPPEKNDPAPAPAPTSLNLPAPTVVVISGLDGGGPDGPDATSSPTASPAGSISAQEERLAAMKERILSSGVSSAASLDADDGTPQNRALRWISDPLSKIDPDDEFVVQRYALAVFYYSTQADSQADLEAGKGWTKTTNWMTSKGYCSWYGIQCHHREGTDPEETTYDGNGGVTHFNLTANNVVGTIPREIAALTDLRVLDLGENGIVSTIPEEIGSLGSLLTLYLGDNKITGTIPTKLGELSQLTHLYLDNNALEGPIPSEFSELTNLHMMGLYENRLTGVLPDFSKMQDLRDLYLDSNALSGELPPSLGALSNLKDLRLGSNRFHGSFPPAICYLSNLSTLYLEKNMISGSLPSQIWNLRNLEQLQIYQNYLTGMIPFHMICLLKKLDVLYLDGNELTGTISRAIAKCNGLSQLYLNDNLLSGPIPVEIRQLTELNRLYLQDNNLEGAIPEEIGELKRLEKVHLHSNDFSGTVPQDVCSLKDHRLVELLSDCGGDQPEVTCDCCTDCF